MATSRKKKKVVAISGGFDPIHIGHIRLIHAASYFGRVVVILNTDQWLLKKKGYYFMTLEERIELLKSIKKVGKVVVAKDEDGTVAATLRELKPDYFANGGAIDEDSLCEQELAACKESGIELVYGIGGTKVQSSSRLVEKLKKNKKEEQSTMSDFKNIIDSFHSLNTLLDEK